MVCGLCSVCQGVFLSLGVIARLCSVIVVLPVFLKCFLIKSKVLLVD